MYEIFFFILGHVCVFDAMYKVYYIIHNINFSYRSAYV